MEIKRLQHNLEQKTTIFIKVQAQKSLLELTKNTKMKLLKGQTPHIVSSTAVKFGTLVQLDVLYK